MLKSRVIKGVLGATALGALFVAMSVQAQSAPGTEQPATGAQQGTAGQVGNQTAPGATGTPARAGASSAPLARADQKIVTDFAQANMSEIEAARMAQSKSQNEQVKNYAQQMIDDHSKALEDVRQLAEAKGVPLPTELDRTHRAKANKLAALSGDAFDRAYMAQAGVADHKKVHSMLRQNQTRARDPDLKALLARTLPVVDQHLHSANQLNKDTARGSSKTQGDTQSSERR